MDCETSSGERNFMDPFFFPYSLTKALTFMDSIDLEFDTVIRGEALLKTKNSILNKLNTNSINFTLILTQFCFRNSRNSPF